MKALIISDCEYKTAVFGTVYEQVVHVLEQKGYEITSKTADSSIRTCTGCYGCWVRTPGECVIRDDMEDINRQFIASDVVVFVSPVIFGHFSANIKNVLDRTLPRLLPFFIKKQDGSTVHPLRYKKNPKTVIIGYGSGLDDEDVRLFTAITTVHHPERPVCVCQGTGDDEKIAALFEEPSAEPVQTAGVRTYAAAAEAYGKEDSADRRKRVVFVNGSPRSQDQTASAAFIARAEPQFDDALFEKHTVQVRKALRGSPEEAFEHIRGADAVVFVFPLYTFCLPGMLARFLQDYAAYTGRNGTAEHRTAVYAVINCGFPEPYINEEAADVIRSFCTHTGMEYRSAVFIGAGVMMSTVQKAPPVQKALQKLDAAFAAMAEDCRSDGTVHAADARIAPAFPRRLFYFFGGLNWKKTAKQNGLTEKDLYRRPYN